MVALCLSSCKVIAVDHQTFATKFENVYAVGDVTSAPVPRVGVMAEGEADRLADVLACYVAPRSPSIATKWALWCAFRIRI